MLCLGQRIDRSADGSELEARDLFVKRVRHINHLTGRKFNAVLGGKFDAECLKPETHVHNFRRMSVAGSQIDQAAFAQHIQRPTVRHLIADDVFAALHTGNSHLTEIADGNFDVKMPRVAKQDVVLHAGEMFLRDDVAASGCRDEDVAERSCFTHGHDAVAVHDGFQCSVRRNLRHDDGSTESAGVFGYAAAAKAVSGDHDCFAGHHAVRRVHDGIPNALTGAVTVVKQVLAPGVIDCNHRELQFPCG